MGKYILFPTPGPYGVSLVSSSPSIHSRHLHPSSGKTCVTERNHAIPLMIFIYLLPEPPENTSSRRPGNEGNCFAVVCVNNDCEDEWRRFYSVCIVVTMVIETFERSFLTCAGRISNFGNTILGSGCYFLSITITILSFFSLFEYLMCHMTNTVGDKIIMNDNVHIKSSLVCHFDHLGNSSIEVALQGLNFDRKPNDSCRAVPSFESIHSYRSNRRYRSIDRYHYFYSGLSVL